MANQAEAADRGRGAEWPSAIPAPGWKDILWRTKSEITDDNVSMIAASVAFYALLALFPAIAAVISLWGLVFDPQQIEAQIQQVSALLPGGAGSIVSGQVQQLVQNGGGGLGLAAIIGLLLTFYSASTGMKAVIQGLNIIYDVEEERGFFRFNLVAFALTLAALVIAIVSLALIAVLPAVIAALGLTSTLATVVSLARWPLLALVALVTLAVIYRYAPNRDAPQWRWVSWGAVLAMVVWIVASVGFSLYVSNFGSYNKTYGSLGAVIILLTWMWLSAFIVLAGGELNAEIEHQTERDTTTGDPKPMGRRGAHAADTVGKRQ